jgi:hypothetical protein
MTPTVKNTAYFEMIIRAQQEIINEQRKLLAGNRDLPVTRYLRMKYFFNEAIKRLESMNLRKSG